ncbi:calpastatin [beta proteobacterium AAP121]|nr:calpastatin [beta proteobacterium AAP65]KPF93728.1 calpastatin [beta proteobacterium AAP121]
MSEEHSDLSHFVEAQASSYEQALSELRAGRKRTHWMWFVLPQLRGLGQSEMSYVYGIKNRAEALAYYMHPVLGTRLAQCVEAALSHSTMSATTILGEVDALKFQSCLTLFASVAPQEPCFAQALHAFYAGKQDQATLRLLAAFPSAA